MRWSKARQQMLEKLQQVERARRSAAEGRLSSARADREEAECDEQSAAAALAAAETGWARHHARARLDVDLARLLAGELLERERDRDERGRVLERALGKEEQERDSWRRLEAKVRSGDDVLGRGRRLLGRRNEARSDNALFDRIIWRWFQQ